MDSVKTMVTDCEAYIIDQRRHFHRFPEVSMRENATTAYLAHELEDMGLHPVLLPCGGCYADIVGAAGGKTVLLRADIDALTITEQTGLDFASENRGIMHACGHDAHMAMLLGAAKVLCAQRETIRGTVRLLFQPAEEVVTGARSCIEAGVLSGVDMCYGAHVFGDIPSGTCVIQAGPVMSSCDKFIVTVHGLSSHAALPHLGRDAILASSAIVLNLQVFNSRSIDAQKASVISVGKMTGGQRFNITADETTIEGTTRTFDADVRDRLEEGIRQIATDTAKTFGCTAEVTYIRMTGVTVNDPQAAQFAREAAEDIYGTQIMTTEPFMGSEDFAFYQERVPGVFVRLGVRTPQVPGSDKPLHSAAFTVDESMLWRGAALAANFALVYLRRTAADD